MLWIFKTALLVYLGFGLYLYLAQRAFMYFPVTERVADDVPSETLLVNGESIRLWVVGGGQDDALLYFGGNGEDVYHNAADVRHALPDRTVYLVNYRGYGGSSGAPTEAGLFADAEALFDRLRSRHRAIAVMGRSLGSAVAVHLADRRPVERLVLATPPDSAVALASALYPMYPVALMLKDHYDSMRRAPRIRVPTLVLTAAEDRLVPARHSERLADAFPPGVVVRATVAGSGHNDLSGHAAYWDTVARFLAAPPG